MLRQRRRWRWQRRGRIPACLAARTQPHNDTKRGCAAASIMRPRTDTHVSSRRPKPTSLRYLSQLASPPNTGYSRHITAYPISRYSPRIRTTLRVRPAIGPVHRAARSKTTGREERIKNRERIVPDSDLASNSSSGPQTT